MTSYEYWSFVPCSVHFDRGKTVFFPDLKPLACGRQSRCLGWTYELPGGQKFSIILSPLSVGFPLRRPLNLIERPRFTNSPGVRFISHPAAYKQPLFCYTSSFCTVNIIVAKASLNTYLLSFFAKEMGGGRRSSRVLNIVRQILPSLQCRKDKER